VATARKRWHGSPAQASTWDALAGQLQDEGAKAFVNSWQELMDVIASKSADLAKAS
jgi:hypothetical protein